jgi:alpha-beta hydrolase superfamily lysophospholipase
MFMAGYEDEDAFDRFRQRLTLEGTGARVACPYLVVAGEEDELSPIEHTERLLAEVAAPKELLLYQGERHGLHSGPASALGPDDRLYVADWLADRLAGRPLPPSRRVYVDVTGRETVTPL